MKRFGTLWALAIMIATSSDGCSTTNRPAKQSPPLLGGAMQERQIATEPVPVSAGEPPAGSNLTDYLATAALNSPEMTAAFNRWQAATLVGKQAGTLPDPTFTYRWYIQEVETRVGPQRQSVQLTQALPWFGKLDNKAAIADQAAEAARHRYDAVKLDLFFRVTEAYCEYYYLKRSIDITAETLALLKNVEAVAQNRYRADAGAYGDLIRTQVELGKTADRLEALRQRRPALEAKLNAAINRPINAPLPWPSTLPAPTPVLDAGILTRQLLSENPRLKALDSEIQRRREQAKLAKKDSYPDFTIGLQWIDTGDRVGPSKPGDSGQDAVIAMLSLNVPLWGAKLDARRRQTRREMLATSAEKAKTFNALQAKLATAVYHYDDAGRKMTLYRDTLAPKARQALGVTEQAYRSGKAAFIDLLDAVRVLLEFELAYERALADRTIRLAELEMLTGTPLLSTAPAPKNVERQREQSPADTGIRHD